MKKFIKLLSITLFFILILFILIKNYRIITSVIPENIKSKLPLSIVDTHFYIENMINLYSNKDYLYNAKFLPDTHLSNDRGNVELSMNKISLNIDKFYLNKFYVDQHKDKIFIFTDNANVFYFSKKEIKLNTKNIFPIKLKTNLDKFENLNLMDSFIEDDNLYISTYETNNGFCNFRIFHSKISFDTLKFNEIFINPGCSVDNIQGGRIQSIVLKKYNKKGLLFSLAENRADYPNIKAQDDKSYLGKMIFLNLANNIATIYSKGHRNPQGLLVEGELILSTEHGPQGGDEINKIIEGENYGWPLASYGKFYNKENKSYLNNHFKNNFKEPIFSYFTAIGISEIVRIPNSFFDIKSLNNIFFISSLRGKSLHLVKFDRFFDRIIFSEKIFINEKIRDLKYLKENNVFLLALQDPVTLGVLIAD